MHAVTSRPNFSVSGRRPNLSSVLKNGLQKGSDEASKEIEGRNRFVGSAGLVYACPRVVNSSLLR